MKGTSLGAVTLGGKSGSYYMSPRNLLDNSDFTNPVNQRGQTEYTSNGYTIDRWELYQGAVGISPLGYVTTSGQMYQKIDIPTDKVYTFAVENDAGIAVVTGIPANGIHSATLGNALIKLATIGEYVEVVIEPSEGYDIAGAYWAALYEGEYTADNLPPYVPKGYAAELAECQRYYENSWFCSDKATTQEYLAAIYSSTQADARIPFKQTKRATATIVYHPITGYDTWRLYNDNKYLLTGSITTTYRNGVDGFIARFTKASDDTTAWTIGKVVQAQGHWEATADL